MNGDRDQLRQTLEQLRRQLNQAERLDPEAEAQLRATLDDIHAALDKRTEAGTAPAEEPTLANRLNEAEASFEAEHPTLAGTLQRLADLLAQIGI
jgi:hypothetical protein